jgi:hypothetical protein
MGTTALLGYFLATRGIGSILSTPVSTALQRITSTMAHEASKHRLGFDVADGRYENMILYTGASFVASAVIIGAGWAYNGVARAG